MPENEASPAEITDLESVKSDDSMETWIEAQINKDWNAELAQMSDFTPRENHEARSRASGFLKAGFESLKAVYDIRKKQRLLDESVPVPELNFSSFQSGAYANLNGITIGLNGDAGLNKLASYLDNANLVINKNGEILFNGNPKDRFSLLLVEEFVHYLDLHRDSSSLPVELFSYLPPDETTSSAEYDAADLEYRALGVQIRVAIDRKMPQRTLDTLRNRMREVVAYRRQQLD